MKILITGIAGFIGSHLAERLLTEGNNIVGIDDLSEGNIKNLPKSGNILFNPTSILDDDGSLYEGVDQVYHLAAFTRPQWSIEKPIESNLVNVEGTIKVLKNCLDKRVKKVVFVSSSSIYGNQTTFPTTEYAIPHPMSPYALQKMIGEQYCELFKLLYGLKANYIRPFNVYGSRQNPNSQYAAAVPTFINNLKNDKASFITGDGKQARDYIYVDDVVDLMIKAMDTKIFGEAFNAGSGKNISINNLYDTISKIMEKDIKPDHVAPVVEPNMTLADIMKPRTLLGWEPKISLEEGLRRTICA